MKNYCGYGHSQILKPPYWALFTADCKIYDENYTKGGTKEDKLNADLGFFWRILHDVNQVSDYRKKKRAIYTAIFYFLCVRLFGWVTFNYKHEQRS